MARGRQLDHEKFRKKRSNLLFSLLVLAVSACGSNVPPEARLSVSPAKKLLTQLGATASLQAAFSGTSPAAVTWSTSDPAVATVDDQGVVTAVAEGKTTVTASGGGLQGSAAITVNTHVVALTVNVRYEDKQLSASGFTGVTAFKAVRYAWVDLIDSSNTVLQTLSTDAQGSVTFDAWPEADSYTLRVYADTDPARGPNVAAHLQNGARYAAVKQIADLQTNPVAMDIAISGGAAGAFNILDVFTSGAEYVYTLAGQYPPKVTGFWTAGGQYGTYFCGYYYAGVCNQGAGIYVYSNLDTDEFDDDVLWHEYGHFIAHSYSRDDSPGGCHYLSSNDLDLRLSWSEGWGDYFPTAVKTWLAADAQRSTLISHTGSTPSTAYVDTYGNSVGAYYDLANLNTQNIYASNELAVARILSQLEANLGAPALWQVFNQYLPGVTGYVNSEALFNGWLSVHTPGAIELSTINNIFSERSIYYQDDVFEPDNDTASHSVAMNTPETHYLYHGGVDDFDKVDVPMIAGKTYTIMTSDLRNGADTFLRLRTNAGTLVAENDDYNNTYYRQDTMCGQTRYFNDGTSLASKIVYVAPSTATYQLEVSRAQDAQSYPAAGHYGTYTLTVQEQ